MSQDQFISKIKENNFIIFLIILIIITSIITYFKILIQISISPQWDSFDFLANALYFSGNGFGYADFIRPPLLSFLTSILFRLGYVSEVTIMAVDGFLFIFGIIGLYLFLNLRFNNLQSFIGSLFYISFPVVLLWVGAGYTDIASTSFSIWAIYFTVLAVKRNSKYFYLSFPFLILAFLSRFPAMITIFLIIFYILINREILKEYKSILGGIFTSWLFIIPAFIFFWKSTGNPFLPFFDAYGSSASTGAVERFALNPDVLYYIKNAFYCFINMELLDASILMALIVFILIIIIFLGIFFYLRNILRSSKINKNIIYYFKFKKSNSIVLYSAILLLVLFFFTFNKINYLISDFIFLIFSLVIYTLLKDNELKNLDIDFLVFLWVTSFLIFNSIFQIKVIRYFIPMAPALAYIIVLGLNEFSSKINFKINRINLKRILSLFLIVSLLFSTGSYIYKLKNDPVSNGNSFSIKPQNNTFKFEIRSKTHSGELYFENYNTNDLKSVAEWLKNYDPDYRNKKIYADYFWPHLSWYLKTEIGGLSRKERIKTNEGLKKRNVTYYIALSDIKLKDYSKIKHFKTNFGEVIIYKEK